ncbi:hypothetical protein JCM10512_2272 [Bacteroides reticulotermitis JCM 10512]|uniref:Uncharacterized protein n=1 Tax=Bacteroides reticulotermitis JCM 10512 TaxID=1445607 RepID=W4UU13_9BACE|nr:hypothetical protein JCM10512_2272 [Bacteroides reticulotermitis JCM 10512]
MYQITNQAFTAKSDYDYISFALTRPNSLFTDEALHTSNTGEIVYSKTTSAG